MFKFSNRQPKEEFSLANLPKGWWIQRCGSEDAYVGSVSQCGEYVVRVCPDGRVFVNEIEEIKRHGRCPVRPAHVEITGE